MVTVRQQHRVAILHLVRHRLAVGCHVLSFDGSEVVRADARRVRLALGSVFCLILLGYLRANNGLKLSCLS